MNNATVLSAYLTLGMDYKALGDRTKMAKSFENAIGVLSGDLSTLDGNAIYIGTESCLSYYDSVNRPLMAAPMLKHVIRTSGTKISDELITYFEVKSAVFTYMESDRKDDALHVLAVARLKIKTQYPQFTSAIDEKFTREMARYDLGLSISDFPVSHSVWQAAFLFFQGKWPNVRRRLVQIPLLRKMIRGIIGPRTRIR